MIRKWLQNHQKVFCIFNFQVRDENSLLKVKIEELKTQKIEELKTQLENGETSYHGKRGDQDADDRKVSKKMRGIVDYCVQTAKLKSTFLLFIFLVDQGIVLKSLVVSPSQQFTEIFFHVFLSNVTRVCWVFL